MDRLKKSLTVHTVCFWNYGIRRQTNILTKKEFGSVVSAENVVSSLLNNSLSCKKTKGSFTYPHLVTLGLVIYNSLATILQISTTFSKSRNKKNTTSNNVTVKNRSNYQLIGKIHQLKTLQNLATILYIGVVLHYAIMLWLLLIYLGIFWFFPV